MDGNSFEQRYGTWALVAGGTEGLGLAFAEAIARRGVNLLLAGRDAQRLEAALDQIRRHHSVKTDGLPCDLSRRDEIDRLVEWIGKRRVGLLVANAAA
ncbi:MAG: SDR family NAD(P)-dependent oxidoreductase, partial [Deltaproteobacteria bacterium]